MRAITFDVTPPTSHPSYQLFDDEFNFRREHIYNLNVLEDGTMVLLGRIRGDLKQAQQVIEKRIDVLDFSISDGADDGGLVYLHATLPPSIERFLELPREHEVFFDFPIEGTRDGKLRVDMLGETDEVLQEALADVPAEMEVSIERIGPYPGNQDAITTVLTDRQRDVLDVALELGYYESPRQATQADIADEMGVADGTVTEHLQKIEARVFGVVQN